MDRNYWNGKTVLVTGHTGFKGSWLCVMLKELGARVVGYGLDPYTERDNFVLSRLQEQVEDIRGDIRDKDKMLSVFQKYEPHVVFHLAAQPLVRLSYDKPVETYETNVMGTMNVLECIRNTKSVKTGILITTDKCYENKEQLYGYRETDRLGGYDPYSSSKACAEILIASYRNSFFNPKDYDRHGKAIASVRAGNVIGGGDWAKDRIVPDCIRAIEESRVISIRSPKAVRPWQHVLEPLSGYLQLAERMEEEPVKFSQGWNFGPENSACLTVSEIAAGIVKRYGKGRVECGQDRSELHEAGLLTLDITKAKMLLGFRPGLNIEETLNLTVEWYKNYAAEDGHLLCGRQVREYLEKQDI